MEDVKIMDARRCGNTTRQIDAAVQKLFTEGKVVWVDHASPSGIANENGFNRLLDRLGYEHRYAFFIMIIDNKNFTITLKKEEG